jgi:hypothetical protein
MDRPRAGAPARRAVLLLAILVLLPAAAAARPSVRQELQEARADRREAVAVARAAADRVAVLEEKYLRVEARASRAATNLVDALIQEREVRDRLAEARSVRDERADAAYRAGPGVYLNALLEMGSIGELIEATELIESALVWDAERTDYTIDAVRGHSSVREGLEDARAGLMRRQEQLGSLLAEMRGILYEARQVAHEAGVRVKALDRQEREVQVLEERNTERLELLEGVDQTELLRMLGPTGGRGCAIPPRLARTGDTFTGEASWYGDELAGNPTATGAIFDPDLFTAAHRTLPLPSFLHITYQGRCATVLVNDRGPYIEPRVLDLSEGAATYLGYASAGVATVTAEILVPR